MGLMAQRPSAIPALTGIRPFASLLVFAFHFCRPVVSGGPTWLRSLVGAGFVAVSFFFVLSGFILAVSHGERLRAGGLDWRRFLVRRVARIYPAYLLALLLLVPLALYRPWGASTGAFPVGPAWHAVKTGLLHLFMVQAWWPPLTLSWNLPGWSVSVEIACYVAFLCLATTLARRSRRARWILLGGLWALSLALTAAYTTLSPEATTVDPDTNAPFINLLKLWPPLRIPEFLFGVTLGLLWREGARSPRWLGAAAATTILLALTHARALPYAMLHNALLLPAFGALLWWVAGARGPAARLLGSRPFVSVGKATYGLYILQIPLMYWLLLASQRAGVSLGGGAFLAVFVPLVLLTTFAVHQTVERQGRRLLAGWLEAILQLGKDGAGPRRSIDRQAQHRAHRRNDVGEPALSGRAHEPAGGDRPAGSDQPDAVRAIVGSPVIAEA
jgi:peptidoglycan/LPS O-acetylase OafA/YrhL